MLVRVDPSFLRRVIRPRGGYSSGWRNSEGGALTDRRARLFEFKTDLPAPKLEASDSVEQGES